MKIIYQTERAECGLVAVAMIANHYGLDYDLMQLRNIYPISMKGTTLRNIIDILLRMNLESRPIRCEVSDVKTIKLPAIIHWNMNHFIVLVKVQNKKFYVNDPDAGKVILTEKEFIDGFTGIALEVWPGPKFQKIDKRNKLRIKTIIPFSSEFKKSLLNIFILSLSIEVATLVIPVLQEIILDDSVVTADTDLLLLLAIAIALFSIGSSVTTAIKSLVGRKLTTSLSLIIPSNVFRHILSLPINWFEKRSAADIANRFESVNTIHKTLTTSVISAIIDGLVGILACLIMFYYNSTLACVVIFTFIFYCVLRFIWYENYRQKSSGSLKQYSKIQSFIWETLRGVATIKQFNTSQKRHHKYLFHLGKYVKLQSELQNINTTYSFIHDFIFAVEKVITIYLGAKLIIGNNFSVGMFTAFMGFRENFISRGSSLISTLIEFRTLSIHFDRLADVMLSNKESENNLPYLGDNLTLNERIKIDGISYSYGENERKIINNCSFEVNKGETVAIVGPSGTGKSTLLKIIAGQLKPISGEILIDDIPITNIEPRQLRSFIAVIRQDDMLFSGTITENIAFLDSKPNFSLVEELSKSVNIHNEIINMPMGYNTLIGPLGTGLSGGQAQRIMLARALYMEPDILLLDEATSHLDLNNEKIVSDFLKMTNITQIIIAHRPETIARADRIIKLSS